MAEVQASGSSASEQEIADLQRQNEELEDDPEPKAKRIKVIPESELKLEDRLNGILRCTVCLDLPRVAMYQCNNGHLMCAMCFSHLLADARLKDETATCPNCRCEISKSQCSRNLAVEKAVSELPTECQFCSKELPRHMLDHHEQVLCQERIMNCQYVRIGCPWLGPFHELSHHEETCSHPSKTGQEIMETLRIYDEKRAEEMKIYDRVFNMLSYEKITFMDLQLRPYRTDDFITKLYYETSRFTAFGWQWVIKARVNDNVKNPAHSTTRNFNYQLICKSRLPSPVQATFLVVQGPFGEMKIGPAVYSHQFTNDVYESNYQLLPIDSHDCNRLLSGKTIGVRLIMLQVGS